MQSLSADTLDYVLAFCTVRTLARLREVSRSMRAAAEEASRAQRVTLHTAADATAPSPMPSAWYRGTVALVWHTDMVAFPPALPAGVTHVRVLRAPGQGVVLGPHTKSVRIWAPMRRLPTLPHVLQRIHMKACHEMADLSPLTSCAATLECIRLEKCSELTDGGLAPLGACYALTSVLLGGCPLLTSASVLEKLPCLDTVALVAWPLLVEVGALPRARNVAFNGCPLLSKVGAAWGQLRSVSIRQCPLLMPGVVSEATHVDFDGMDDASLEALARRCPEIIALAVSGSPLVTDAGVEAAANALGATLAVAAFTGAPQLTDASVRALARLRLKAVFFSGCPLLTDASLRALSEVGTLQDVRFEACLGLSDVGVGEVGKCPRLAAAGFPYCPQLTGASLRGLCGATLKSVNFSKAGPITDDDLAAFVGGCPALEQVSLVKSPILTDEGLRVLAAVPTLRRAFVSKCPKTTEAGHKELEGVLRRRGLARK